MHLNISTLTRTMEGKTVSDVILWLFCDWTLDMEILQMAEQCSSTNDIRRFVFEESACKLVGMEKGFINYF